MKNVYIESWLHPEGDGHSFTVTNLSRFLRARHRWAGIQRGNSRITVYCLFSRDMPEKSELRDVARLFLGGDFTETEIDFRDKS